MSLSSQAIDRLFDRLAATYGQQWFRMWEGVDSNAVKSLWAHELSPFSGISMHRIAWALENLPSRCPNAVEFKTICRLAPEPEGKKLPEPKADPARVQAELEKLGAIVKKPSSSWDMKDWARRLHARHEAGDKLHPIQISMYRAALRLDVK